MSSIIIAINWSMLALGYMPVCLSSMHLSITTQLQCLFKSGRKYQSSGRQIRNTLKNKKNLRLFIFKIPIFKPVRSSVKLLGLNEPLNVEFYIFSKFLISVRPLLKYNIVKIQCDFVFFLKYTFSLKLPGVTLALSIV